MGIKPLTSTLCLIKTDKHTKEQHCISRSCLGLSPDAVCHMRNEILWTDNAMSQTPSKVNVTLRNICQHRTPTVWTSCDQCKINVQKCATPVNSPEVDMHRTFCMRVAVRVTLSEPLYYWDDGPIWECLGITQLIVVTVVQASLFPKSSSKGSPFSGFTPILIAKGCWASRPPCCWAKEAM